MMQTSPVSESTANNNVAVICLFALLCVVLVIVTGYRNSAIAHESDDELDEAYEGRWAFECEDVVSGCDQGGLLFHTKDGPDGNVYFIAHYGDTGNVYARKVTFRN